MKNKTVFLLFAFVAIFVSAISFSCTSTKNVQASENSIHTKTITISQGDLVGIYSKDGTVEIYAGIPYAKPPLNALRWTYPQDAEKWEGTFIADTFAPMSMQKRDSALWMWLWNNFAVHKPKGDRTDNAPCSEDCLYLNIWKPAGEKTKLPVLVYIHGGSLVGGSSFFSEYDGENIAKNDIIQVNIDYRTGIFGFLALDELAKENEMHATGNYGFLDQIKALEWVKKNIEAFGGDSENITIAGESAGSSCVSALCASPLAKGLFKNAIGESSSVALRIPSHTFYSTKRAKFISEGVKQQLEAESVEELRKMPAKKLVKYTQKFNGLTVDGYALKEYPWETYQKGENNEKALLNGYNKNEGHAFMVFTTINKKNYPELLEKAFPGYWEPIYALLPAATDKEARLQYEKIFTANAFSYAHHVWSEVASKCGVDVYEYYFTKDNGGIGSNHSGELIYCYGNVPKSNKHYDETDYDLEDKMMSYWINFVKTGNPNGKFAKTANRELDTLPTWQNYNALNGKIFELGLHVGPIDEELAPLYPLLKNYRDTLNVNDKLNWDSRD